jgi:hypothetical protein
MQETITAIKELYIDDLNLLGKVVLLPFLALFGGALIAATFLFFKKSSNHSVNQTGEAEGRCKCIDSDPAPVCGSCGKLRR